MEKKKKKKGKKNTTHSLGEAAATSRRKGIYVYDWAQGKAEAHWQQRVYKMEKNTNEARNPRIGDT